MRQLSLPDAPSRHEDMVLRGCRSVAGRNEFLLVGVPRASRLHG